MAAPEKGGTHMMRQSVRWLTIALLLLAFALRVYQLDHQELRGDETFGYFFSLQSFSNIVKQTIELKEPHPVAGYFIEKVWLAVAGHSEFSLRFVSAWCGTLAVALLLGLAMELALSREVALAAACLLTVTPYTIWHSQDARMYSMSLALTLASTLYAMRWLQRRDRSNALVYVGVSWLALQTHYFAVFVLLAQNLFVLGRGFVNRRLRSGIRSWLLLQLALGVLYLPWLMRVGKVIAQYHGNGDSPSFVSMWQRALSVFVVGETIPASQRWLWAGLGALLILLGMFQLFAAGERKRRSAWFLGAYLAVPLLATWYGARQRPIFNERYLVAAAPPFYLLAAGAWDGLSVRTKHGFGRAATSANVKTWRARLHAAGMGGLWLVLIGGMLLALNRYYTDPSYSKTRGWRKLAQTVTLFATGMPAGTVRIAQNYPDPTLWYYYNGPVDHVVLPPMAHDRSGADREVQKLVDAGVERVILPIQPAPNWDDAHLAVTALAQQFTLITTQPEGNWPVNVYTRPPAQWRPVADIFTNGLTLTGFSMQPDELLAGDVLAVHLRWQAKEPQLSGTEKVFVQLLNEQGRLFAQQDRPFAPLDSYAKTGTNAAEVVTSYGILIPENVSPGAYRLIAGLYDPAQASAARVQTTDGQDFVSLTELRTAHPKN